MFNRIATEGLVKMVTIETERPADAMLRLGKAYRRAMDARLKAMNAGAMAIHDALCEVTKANMAEQKALLAKHPELALMFCEGK